MHILRDSKAIEAFLATSPPDAELHGLISGRIEELSEFIDEDISELVNFVVLEGSDSASQLQEALGFSPLANRFDGHPYGSPEFTPSWDSLVDHLDWYELTYVMSDDGFGLVLYIPKRAGIDPLLLAMCAQYAEEIHR